MDQSLAAKIKEANSSLIAAGNFDSIADFFSADYLVHYSEKDAASGHEIIRKAIALLKGAFPTIEVEVEIFVQSGNRIAWMRTLSGVQEGRYKGFPASSQKIVWREMVTSEFRDGLITEEWVVTDLAEKLLLARKR